MAIGRALDFLLDLASKGLFQLAWRFRHDSYSLNSLLAHHPDRAVEVVADLVAVVALGGRKMEVNYQDETKFEKKVAEVHLIVEN